MLSEIERRLIEEQNELYKQLIKETETKWEYQAKLDELWDNEDGLGAVPINNKYPNYKMRIKNFLDLVPEVDTSDLEFYKKHIRSGGKYGMPFLIIEEYEDGKFRVHDHEGRHRLEAIASTLGDLLYIPVTIYTPHRQYDFKNDVDVIEPQYDSRRSTPFLTKYLK